MTIIGLFVLIALIGLAAWALTTFVPMPDQIKKLLIVAAVIIVVLIILNAVGLLDMSLGTVPRVHSR